MSRYGIRVCAFGECTDHLRGQALTYEALKAAVLEAGRFSCFEATRDRRRAALFDRLCKDPALQVETLGFPWTKVTTNKA